MERRIIRGTRAKDIQAAHDSLGTDAETCRSYYAIKDRPITLEEAVHDRAEYKGFDISGNESRDAHRVHRCLLCGHVLHDNELDGHDRLHKMGATIL